MTISLSINLAASYNFRKVSNFHALFTRLIVKELLSIRERLDGEPLRALNVGCGIGIGRNTALLLAVHDHIDEHWGVEPDESVKGPSDLQALSARNH